MLCVLAPWGNSFRTVEEPDGGNRYVRAVLFARFRDDQNAAVTVDWVVLVAAAIVLGAVAISTVGSATMTNSGVTAKCLKIQGKLISKDISYEKQLKRMRKRCGRL